MNRLVVILVAAVLIVGTGVVTVLLSLGEEPAELGSRARLTADFRLIDDAGAPVTIQDFDGRASAWFFGFTHCPDICPTALAEMTAQLGALGADAGQIDMVFVTVDPERDTPEVMRAYVGAFDDRIVGVTGPLGEIEKLARGFFVYFAKVPLANGGYTMNHTAGVLLRGPDGAFLGTLDPHESMDVKLQKLRAAIEA